MYPSVSPDMEKKELQESIRSWVKQIFDEVDARSHCEVQNSIRKLISKSINKEPMVVTTFYEI